MLASTTSSRPVSKTQPELPPNGSSPKARLTAKANKTISIWTGFTMTTSFLLFLLTVGIFSIFSGFQTHSLNEGHRLKPKGPGEQFWYLKDVFMKWSMQLHLTSVIPAGVLLPIQFLPIMRLKYLYFHKVTGRLLLSLLIVGNITAVILVKHSFGGTMTTQIWAGTLALLTSCSAYKSWTSILNFRIDRHRIWVIRTWSYACTILTMRIFMIIIAVTSVKISPNAYKFVFTCDQLIYTYKFVTNSTSLSSFSTRYPACDLHSSDGSDIYVIVNASLNKAYPEEKAALMNLIFGVSSWLALVLHMVLTELYLNLTDDENDRLKKISVTKRRMGGLESKSDSKSK